MIRLLAVLAALGAALLTAPAAFGATFVVTSNADSGAGSLRDAIDQANAAPGADTITFAASGQNPAPVTALPQVTDQLSIDGGGATTVSFAPTATGTLLDLRAANSLVKAITFEGGGSGLVLNLGAGGDRLDTVTVRNTPAAAIGVAGSGGRVDGSRVANAGGLGINITGGSATVTNPDISGGSTSAIVVSGDGATISGGHVHDNHGDGVAISGQHDVVTGVTFYSNSGKPIAKTAGANGGIAPPQNLRIGPRRPDGSLPLTGSGAAGTVELWSGDPSSASPPSHIDSFSISGDFTYNFANEPAPGSVFALSLIGNGLGSSEFATVAVPADTSSPDINFARALDTSTVRVDFSEPLDAGSVQREDFKLTMAGVERPVDSAAVAPDGRFVTLTSPSWWRAGEAGYVDVNGVGAVTDTSGNAMLSAPHLRVAAAPGDFIAPLGAQLRVSPKTICLTRGRKCRRTGMVIKFLTTEAGKARLVIKRSNKTVGSRLYGNIVPGLNTLKWNGRLGSRKLRAGRYRLLIYVQDQVGNVTDQPPITLFNVRRVSK